MSRRVNIKIEITPAQGASRAEAAALYADMAASDDPERARLGRVFGAVVPAAMAALEAEIRGEADPRDIHNALVSIAMTVCGSAVNTWCPAAARTAVLRELAEDIKDALEATAMAFAAAANTPQRPS